MGEIYGSAEETLIWLGPRTEQRFFLHHYYRQFLALADAELATPEDRDLAVARIFGTATYEVRVKLLQEVMHLGRLSWFGRIWTFQEYALARSCTFFYGDFTFRGKEFLKFVELFIRVSGSDQKLARALRFVSRHCFFARLKSRELITEAQERPEVIISLLDRAQGCHSFTAILLELLEQTAEVKATNPRDRILALLGACKVLASTLGQTTQDGFLAHGGSCSELEASLAKEAVLTVPFLKVLRFARYFEEHHDIPSWMPDFTKSPHGTMSNQRYDASLMIATDAAECCRGRQIATFLDQTTSILREKLGVRAVPCGKIHRVHLVRQDPSKASGTVNGQDYDTLRAMLTFCISIPERYWNKDRKDDGLWQTLYSGNPAVTQLEFRVGLMTGLYLHSREQPAKRVESGLDFLTTSDVEHLTKVLGFNVLEDYQSVPHVLESKGTEQAAYLDELVRKRPLNDIPASDQYLVSINNDRIGSTMWPCHADDEMWIIQGGEYPFILRPTSQPGHFHLIGDAYVDEIMRGEAIAEQGSDVSWQTIWLV